MLRTIELDNKRIVEPILPANSIKDLLRQVISQNQTVLQMNHELVRALTSTSGTETEV